jgi:ADP-dependent phosphofructokinase/glucokinase
MSPIFSLTLAREAKRAVCISSVGDLLDLFEIAIPLPTIRTLLDILLALEYNKSVLRIAFNFVILGGIIAILLPINIKIISFHKYTFYLPIHSIDKSPDQLKLII